MGVCGGVVKYGLHGEGRREISFKCGIYCSVYLSQACRLYTYPPLHSSTRSNSIKPITSPIIRTVTRRPCKFRRCPLGKFVSRQLLIRRRLHRIWWRDYTPLASESSLPSSLHRIPCLTRRQYNRFPHSLTATLSRSPHLWHIIVQRRCHNHYID